MTEAEILRGRLAAAEAGIEIITRERDQAWRDAAILRMHVAAGSAHGATLFCALTRTRARLARVLRSAGVVGRGTAYDQRTGRRGRVWSRRLAP